MTTSTTKNDNNNISKTAQDSDFDIIPDTGSVPLLSQCNVPLGAAKDDPVLPKGDSFRRYHIGVAITCSVIVLIGSIAAWILQHPSNGQPVDIMTARVFGCLSMVSVVSIILVMLCAASSYQNHHYEESKLRNLLNLTIYTSILYGIGVMNVVFLVVASKVQS